MEKWLITALLAIVSVTLLTIAFYVWAFLSGHHSFVVISGVSLFDFVALQVILLYCLVQRKRQN